MTEAVKTIDDGGSAYPLPVHLGLEGDEHVAYPGMSLRDWFAGQALVGLTNAFVLGGSHNLNSFQLEVLAKNSFAAADFMIAARKEGA